MQFDFISGKILLIRNVNLRNEKQNKVDDLTVLLKVAIKRS